MNTIFSDILHEEFVLLNKDPKILKKIEHDLDCYAMMKKTKRLADKVWRSRHTVPLWAGTAGIRRFIGRIRGELRVKKEITISLGIGRPRMKPETVFLFMLLRGYFNSVTDVRATDRIIDSITILSFFQNYGWGNLPKRSTIHDNIQAVSYDTRTYIYRSQLADVRDQGIDDYKRLTLDSTAVMANSKWPIDSGVISRLLERAFKNSQCLSKYGAELYALAHSTMVIEDQPVEFQYQCYIG